MLLLLFLFLSFVVVVVVVVVVVYFFVFSFLFPHFLDRFQGFKDSNSFHEEFPQCQYSYS
jgi:hypothetical protein